MKWDGFWCLYEWYQWWAFINWNLMQQHPLFVAFENEFSFVSWEDSLNGITTIVWDGVTSNDYRTEQ